MADDEKNVDEMLADLRERLEALVEAARKQGAETALAEIRSVVSNRLGDADESKSTPKRSRRKKSTAKKKSSRKGSKKASSSKKSGGEKKKKKRRNPWDHMTPEQRKERVRKMLAGRGLKPKDER